MEELDLLSPHFSPIKALYSDKVPLPAPNVKALDNISKCRWLLPHDDPNYRPQTKPKPAALHAVESVSVAAKAAPAAPQASKPAAASSAASALPAPAVAPPPKDPLLVVPSSTQPAPPRQQPASVYAELIAAYETGPLSVLRRAVVERRQVKVWTRSAVGVRATLTGTPLLFDKHMNLVLRGVREEMNSTATVRAFDQILLRGEHVILVALLPSAQPAKRKEKDDTGAGGRVPESGTREKQQRRDTDAST